MDIAFRAIFSQRFDRRIKLEIKMKNQVKIAIAASFLIGAACDAARAAEPHWTWCGWGGGGWFWSSAADPVDANTFYMGGDVNGLWKTVDGGRSWAFMNNGLPNYEVYSLAVAPSDRNTVYALTVDGVAVSTDGAKSWTHCIDTKRSGLNVGASRGGSIHALAVDYRNPRIVYAGGKNGRAVKSIDGGASWTEMDYLSSRKAEEGEIAKPVSGSGFGRIAVATNPNDWSNYIRVQKFLSQSGEDWSDAKTISANVFIPKDAPAGMAATIVVQSGGWAWKEGPMQTLKPGTWTELEYPLSLFADPGSVNMVHFVVRTNGKGYQGEIAVDAFVVKGGSKRIVLGEWDGADTEGWVVSPDQNTKSVTKSFKTSKAPAAAPSGAPVCTIAVSGANGQTVLLCQRQRGLFRSPDGGKTWRHLADAPAGARCVFWAGKSRPSTWYGAFDKNGFFVSNDDGLTWTSLNAPIPGDFGARDVVCSRKNPDLIYGIVGAGFGGYIASSADGGKTWAKTGSFKADNKGNPTLPGNGPTGGMSGLQNIAISPVNPDYLHMAGNWNPCFTHDGGKVWVESVRGADITCFHDIRHLGTETYGAAMDEGICMTTDGGRFWKALCPIKWKPGLSGHQWQVLPLKLPNGQTRIVSTVSPWAHNGDFPVKVIVSDDSGKTFVEAKGLPTYRTHLNTMWGEGHGRTLQADPTNPDVIYVGIDGDPENGHAGGGLFKSTDGGKTFTQMKNQPGSRRMMYGLAIDPTNPKRLIWGACGNTAGVYVSEDGGESWTKTPGLNDWIFRVEATDKGIIYAGGNQLYRSDDHGKSFRVVTNLKGVTICGIAWDPADENRVWIAGTTWSSNSDAPNTGVYETTDGCKTWHSITGDIGYRKPIVLRYNATTKELWAAGPAAFKLKR